MIRNINRNNWLNVTIFFLVLLFLGSSCKKYLDKKPIITQVVPHTLSDLQALLDNNNIINGRTTDLIGVLDDDYYVIADDYNNSSEEERLNYIWDQQAFYKAGWNTPYQGSIYYSNVILDVLPNISYSADSTLYNTIKGSALFHRAFSFFQIAQLFCKPYTTTASTEPGIVLRLTSAIEAPSVRSTVQQTYDQIINDLNKAIDLLPSTTDFPTKPTKAAAYGMLARVYLSMGDYTNAGVYANLCLQTNSSLMDFNTINAPMERFNKETIFYHYCFAVSSILYPTYAKVDTTLYASYDDNDLRKQVFFYEDNGSAYFQGSYDLDNSQIFDGIITDEIYLIRAECFARAGNTASAMADLNTLLQSRWASGTFVPYSASDASDALKKILTERRKELIGRGLRWSDLRRFNAEGANITLKRVINGNTYTLPPNDPRWILLIPPDVIARTGIQQNPRP
jgi:starch-binding outer membrane protein, SusD/RagB family